MSDAETLALFLDARRLTLARAATTGQWEGLGAAETASRRLAAELAALRDLAGLPPRVWLVLPSAEVREERLPAPEPPVSDAQMSDWLLAQAEDAAGERLLVDWHRAGEEIAAAAIPSSVLEEAIDFAHSQGFEVAGAVAPGADSARIFRFDGERPPALPPLVAPPAPTPAIAPPAVKMDAAPGSEGQADRQADAPAPAGDPTEQRPEIRGQARTQHAEFSKPPAASRGNTESAAADSRTGGAVDASVAGAVQVGGAEEAGDGAAPTSRRRSDVSPAPSDTMSGPEAPSSGEPSAGPPEISHAPPAGGDRHAAGSAPNEGPTAQWERAPGAGPPAPVSDTQSAQAARDGATGGGPAAGDTRPAFHPGSGATPDTDADTGPGTSPSGGGEPSHRNNPAPDMHATGRSAENDRRRGVAAGSRAGAGSASKARHTSAVTDAGHEPWHRRAVTGVQTLWRGTSALARRAAGSGYRALAGIPGRRVFRLFSVPGQTEDPPPRPALRQGPRRLAMLSAALLLGLAGVALWPGGEMPGVTGQDTALEGPPPGQDRQRAGDPPPASAGNDAAPAAGPAPGGQTGSAPRPQSQTAGRATETSGPAADPVIVPLPRMPVASAVPPLPAPFPAPSTAPATPGGSADPPAETLAGEPPSQEAAENGQSGQTGGGDSADTDATDTAPDAPQRIGTAPPSEVPPVSEGDAEPADTQGQARQTAVPGLDGAAEPPPRSDPFEGATGLAVERSPRPQRRFQPESAAPDVQADTISDPAAPPLGAQPDPPPQAPPAGDGVRPPRPLPAPETRGTLPAGQAGDMAIPAAALPSPSPAPRPAWDVPMLIGTFGRATQPRALVRLPAGTIVRVGAGDAVNGAKVVWIGDGEIRLARGGESFVLTLPR